MHSESASNNFEVTSRVSRMVTESDIAARLKGLIGTVDLQATSVKDIRKQLEDEFGEDLSSMKGFIKSQIISLINKQKEDKNDAGDGEGDDDEADGDEDDVSEELPARKAKKTTHRKRKKTFPLRDGGEAPEKKRKGSGGLNAVCQLSETLASFVGVDQAPRTEVVKKIWQYIKEHNLQDPENKRRILCDDTLKEIFQTDATDMFKMNKLLSKHIYKIEGGAAAARKDDEGEGEDEA